MKRSDVLALGLEKDAVDAIMELHKTDAELWKLTKGELEEEIRELSQKPSAPQSDGVDWEKKYNDEVKAHQATRDGYVAEKDAADIDALVAAQLKVAGMNEKAIPKALKLYDRTTVERDKEGSIKNADNVLAAFKAEWGDFFGEVTQQGAAVGTPPAGGGILNPFTKEHFNLQAQTELFRTNPRLAREMAATVGVKLYE